MDNFWLTKERLEKARVELDLAHARLELAGIKHRLAEIKNQHEPLHSVGINREAACSVAFYVVVGRMPSNEPKSD